MKGCGYKPEQFFIIHLREGYNSNAQEIECLMMTDVTEKLITLQDYIEKNVLKAFAAFSDHSLLKIQPGEQCQKPYLCDFSGYCSKKQNRF
jgi:hypothetical protein